MSQAFIPTSTIKASRQEKQWNLDCSEPEALKNLSGHVFVVAPLPPPEDQPERGERAFPNGDGMIYRLSFQNGQATLKTAIAKTPCYYADLATQYDERFRGMAFRDGGVVRMSLALGSRNQLNTAFLKTKRRLFVTYDAGRPYILDPDSLEIVEPIGTTKDWLMIFAGLLPISNVFQPYSGSAHPVAAFPTHPDENGAEEGFITNYSSGYNGKFAAPVNRLLNALFDRFNQLNQGRIRLLENSNEELKSAALWGSFTDLIRYRVNSNRGAKGEYQLERWRLELPNGSPVIIKQSVHQMGITEKFVILGDLSFGLEYSQIFSPFLLGFLWQPGFKKVWFSTPLGIWLYRVFLQLLESPPFTDFYLVRREDLDRYPSCGAGSSPKPLPALKLSMPRTVSHFTVDYSNKDNKLIFHVGHHNGLDPTEWINQYDQPAQHWKSKGYLRKDLRGAIVGTIDLGSFTRYEFDTETGTLLKSQSISDPGSISNSASDLPEQANTWLPSVYTHCDIYDNPEQNSVKHIYWMSWGFSWELVPQRIYAAYRDRQYREIPLENLPNHDLPFTLLCLDTEQMQISDAYVFPHGTVAYSPQFVPGQVKRPEIPASQDGYITCFVLSDDAEQPNRPKDEIWIFDAADLQTPPIKLAHRDLNLGASLHSTWVSDTEFERFGYSDVERHDKREQSVHQDYDDVVTVARSRGQNRIVELFKQIIFPNFTHQTSEEEMKNILNNSNGLLG